MTRVTSGTGLSICPFVWEFRPTAKTFFEKKFVEGLDEEELKGLFSNIPCTSMNVSKDWQDNVAKMTSIDEKELYRLMNKSDVMAEARELHEVFPENDLPADNANKQIWVEALCSLWEQYFETCTYVLDELKATAQVQSDSDMVSSQEERLEILSSSFFIQDELVLLQDEFQEAMILRNLDL